MKTKVIVEEPMFVLYSGCYNSLHSQDIYAYQIKAMTVGEIFEQDEYDCGRGIYCQSLECVHKTNEGVAVLFREWGTTNSDNPEDYKRTPELIWFEIAG